jgi:hypothetical protein
MSKDSDSLRSYRRDPRADLPETVRATIHLYAWAALSRLAVAAERANGRTGERDEMGDGCALGLRRGRAPPRRGGGGRGTGRNPARAAATLQGGQRGLREKSGRSPISDDRSLY